MFPEIWKLSPSLRRFVCAEFESSPEKIEQAQWPSLSRAQMLISLAMLQEGRHHLSG
jgi:hypothetical protein